MDSRTAAINSLARLQKDNKDITKQIAGYLTEPHFPVRMAAISALGGRGDATAIPALEALLKSDDLSIEMAPMIKGQIARLKKPRTQSRAQIPVPVMPTKIPPRVPLAKNSPPNSGSKSSSTCYRK